MPKGVEWIFDILTNISQNIQNMQVQKTKQNFLLHILLKFIYYFVIEIRCNKLYLPIKISRLKSSNLRINLFGLDVLLLYKIWIYKNVGVGPICKVMPPGALCNFFCMNICLLATYLKQPATTTYHHLSFYVIKIYINISLGFIFEINRYVPIPKLV